MLGSLFQLRENFSHHRSSAEKFRGAAGCFLSGDPQFGAAQARGQCVHSDWLGEVVKQAVARQSDGLAQIRQAGDHHNRCVGIASRKLIKEIIALTVGQVVIEQHEVERLTGRRFTRLGKILCHSRLATFIANDLRCHRSERCVVVHDETGEFFDGCHVPRMYRKCVGIQAWKSGGGIISQVLAESRRAIPRTRMVCSPPPRHRIFLRPARHW